MPACLLVFHHLLHVAETLRLFGPLGSTWSFVMERYIGILGPIVRSRKLPAQNLANTCLMINRLNQIPYIYANYNSPEDTVTSRIVQTDTLMQPKSKATLSDLQIRHLRQTYAAMNFTSEDQQVFYFHNDKTYQLYYYDIYIDDVLFIIFA